jgi:hypothetical protein
VLLLVLLLALAFCALALPWLGLARRTRGSKQKDLYFEILISIVDFISIHNSQFKKVSNY